MKYMLIALGLLLAMGGPAQASEDWTDSEIVAAIYQAEGGNKAQYPYGIRSVRCEGKEECEKVCRNTVRNNRARYAKNPGNASDFLTFLARRYAPVGASNDPLALNKNWLKNVKFFLAKNRGAK